MMVWSLLLFFKIIKIFRILKNRNEKRNAAWRIQYPLLLYTVFVLHLFQKLVKSRYTVSENLWLSQNLEMISRARSTNWKLFFSITFIPVDISAKYTFYLENP